MKKKIILAVILLLTFCGGVVAASSINGEYRGNPIVKIRVNDAEIHPEVPGQIIDGSTMLPLRSVSAYLGANVQWHQEDYSVDISMPKQLSLAQLNKIGEGVGLVYALDANGGYISQGSGFLLDGGILVTCEHVVTGSSSLRIDLNGKVYTTNQYLFRNPTTDLAAVKIDADVELKYNTTTLPGAGQKVYSLGFPNGKFQINEGLFASWDGHKITHNAMTYPGSSGGILIDRDGEVIGVTSSAAENTEINKAIPMSVVIQELSK